MHKYLWMLLVVAMLAPACARKVDVEQQKASLMAADSSWAQTTTDPEKLMSFFDADGALLPQGMPAAQGHDAIHQFITGMMATPGFALTWKASKADVSASGDLGYTVGAYQMSVKDSTAAAPTTETGKYVTVWKKQADGQWKVVQDIFNADAPPPPPPAPVAAKKKK